MYKFILVSFFSFLFLKTFSQNYKPADAGSKVHFVIKNFSINTGGDISGLKGNVVFNPSALAKSLFDVSVDVNTLDTDNGSRDAHLKSDDYFDAAKYPVITIRSAKIDRTNRTSAGYYFFTGTLTLHGITKEISFPFKAKQQGNDYLFTGNFEINRVDYGVGDNSSVMSKTVKISLSVLAKKS
ncbi:MAG: YceI family protein [Chitinophagaceae bacterium]|nr:YceI family protein [Chitinophagaceae bacterium]